MNIYEVKEEMIAKVPIQNRTMFIYWEKQKDKAQKGLFSKASNNACAVFTASGRHAEKFKAILGPYTERNYLWFEPFFEKR
jgi:hypothetical protein